MQLLRTVRLCLVSAAVMAPPALAAAQTADAQALSQEVATLKADLETLRRQYAERLAALEARLAALQQETAGVAQPAQPAADTGQAAVGNARSFNLDTSVVGNFVGLAGRNPVSDQPSLSLSEVEAAFQAVVDPYARADFFLAAGPEGLEIEEGFVTFTSLPAGFLLRVGKMREQFGKANLMHTHILPWADRPLVLQNLLGGEEGVADSGFSISRLVPNGFMFLDAVGEVYQGNTEVFHSDTRSKLQYLGRLRGYRDLTEGTNLDLGVSYAQGPSAAFPDFDARLTGVDATFRYRPLRRAIYQQFVGRTEMIWSRQEGLAGGPRTAFGFYGSADYQFARRWFVGVRGDRSGRAADPTLHDSGGSVLLTFRPSEFSLIRGQYRRTNYAEGINADELLVQFNFAIGAHGAHPF